MNEEKNKLYYNIIIIFFPELFLLFALLSNSKQ
jgi:hypothetical protein